MDVEYYQMNYELAKMELVEYNYTIVRNFMHVDDIENFENL